MTDFQDIDTAPSARVGDARSMVRDYASRQRRREAVLPGLLVAGGAVWFAAILTRDTRFARRLHLDEPLSHLKEAGDVARSHLADAVDQLRGRAEDVQGAATERLAGLRATAADLGGTVNAQVRRAKRRYDAALEAEPMVLAAVGVAIGVGLAVLWPATETERRVFGRTARRMADEAKARISDIEAVAGEAFAQAKEELHRQTGADGETGLIEKAGAVLQAGADAATEALAPKSAKRTRAAAEAARPPE